MNTALQKAIAASCPGWCTSSRHPVLRGEEGGVASVAHSVVLFARDDRRIDVLRWEEFAADGTVVDTTTTLSVTGFDHSIVRAPELAELAAAMVRALAIVAGAAT